MVDNSSSNPGASNVGFDPHAVSIAKRQYFQPGEESVEAMFHRVAAWVAQPERPELRDEQADRFYRLMASKSFCPGGRVLAGANTLHGNVLNCFVQDGSPEQPGTDAWVLNLARKLALVTKVGGGNGVNLDPIAPKRHFTGTTGRLYLTAGRSHADYQKIRSGTFFDVAKGEMVTRGYRAGTFVERDHLPAGVSVRLVGDSVDDIWQAAADAVTAMLAGRDIVVDLSDLRAEGTPVAGSGGTSSGPSSFAVEVYDNFAVWAGLGGARFAGPVATLRHLFAPTLRAIRQGGCLHPDTLVNTSKGTLRLSELVDAHQTGWQDHYLKVATDEGWKASPRGFNNGVVETLRVTLANGQSLRGTRNHKLKVIRENGRREWVEFDDLTTSDRVIQVLDQHTGAPVTLQPVDPPEGGAKLGLMPGRLTERMAFFLGYLWGDGFVASGRVGISVAHGSPMQTEAPRLFEELFGLSASVEQGPDAGTVSYVADCPHLGAWLEANGLDKPGTREAAIPRAVRMSSRPVVGAFLRGLFEASGSLSRGVPQVSTASPLLAEDVATMLAGLGIPSKLTASSGTHDRNASGKVHRLSVVSHKGLKRFVERVGFLEGSRLEAAEGAVPESVEQSWQLPHPAAAPAESFRSVPVGTTGRPAVFSATRQATPGATPGELRISVTCHGLRTFSHEADQPEFGHDEYYVGVASVKPAGRALTLDLSVDENKTYLAGGFVTHNTRRGAGMATLAITHPDLQDFVTAKDLDRERAEGDISTFNISVLVTNEFMDQGSGEHGRGTLWEIAQHAWATGEPGLIYVDRINEHNPMRSAMGDIRSTNPCGEIPLYPGEPCDLGAINLAAYVTQRDVGLAGYDFDRYTADVTTCVRFLDNVLDVNKFALEDNREMSMKLRRLGLGVMGLADALILMGYGYDSDEGRDAVAAIIGALRNAATQASQALAAERGAFPLYDVSDLTTPRRNVAILTVAPTGTTSMLMGVSSGVEPVFAPFIYRKIGTGYHALIHPLFQELLEEHAPHPDYELDGRWDWEKVVAAVQGNHGSVQGLHFIPEKVRAVLVCAHDISPAGHVRMQGVVQRAFDDGDRAANSISKTINLPNQATTADVFDAYRLAFATGCKGITVYRDGSRDFQVLSTSKDANKEPSKEPSMEPSRQAAAPAPTADLGSPSANVISTAAAGKAQVAPHAMAASAEASRTATAAAQDPSPQGRPVTPEPSEDRLPGEPLFNRPTRLSGFTDSVKLMLPSGEKRGFFVTVNMQDGLPAEVFIVSGKAGDEANADSEALGRVVSIALQYGVPAEALVKTLRGINGGMFGTYQGRMVASKADLLAVALETVGVKNVLNNGKACPDCGAPLRFEEGCQKCESCGYSKCG